jgi:hypothetical protein
MALLTLSALLAALQIADEQQRFLPQERRRPEPFQRFF